MVAAVANSIETESAGGYVPISLDAVLPDSLSGMRLFLKDSPKSTERLFCAEDTPFLDADRQRLIETGQSHLYIRAGDRERFRDYLRENIGEIVNNAELTSRQRLAALSEVTRDSLATAFERVNLDETLTQVNELAEHSVDLFSCENFQATNLTSVLSHDFHTFTHSANVSFYCVLLAKELGIRERKDLHQISVGGFLHDVGKLEIPAAILTKPDKLTDFEYLQVKDHPRRGFEMLSCDRSLSWGQLMMVYQHHERIDGGGYPVGCTGDDIHPWAKICTVVDVFEALTSNRPYRDGYANQFAVKIQSRDNGTAFEPEYLECWTNVIKQS